MTAACKVGYYEGCSMNAQILKIVPPVMVHKEVNCKTWLLQHHIFHILVTHCKINFLKMRIFVMVTHTSLISSGVTGAACGLSPYGNQTPSRWLRCLFESRRGGGVPTWTSEMLGFVSVMKALMVVNLSLLRPLAGSRHPPVLLQWNLISCCFIPHRSLLLFCESESGQESHLCTWTYVQHFWFPKLSWWYTNLH